eukprot:scaffold16735_cov33-Tisochrysis_lutea.AAC.6
MRDHLVRSITHVDIVHDDRHIVAERVCVAPVGGRRPRVVDGDCGESGRVKSVKAAAAKWLKRSSRQLGASRGAALNVSPVWL